MAFERPDVDTWMMNLAWKASERSTCLRRKCGCIIARGNRPLIHGYNGSASREKHCREIEIGCLRQNSEPGQDLDLCRGLHAEAGAISIASKYGIATDGATMYVTHRPCKLCWPLIANAGIVCVKYEQDYPDLHASEIPGTIRVERIER